MLGLKPYLEYGGNCSFVDGLTNKSMYKLDILYAMALPTFNKLVENVSEEMFEFASSIVRAVYEDILHNKEVTIIIK